MIILQYIKKISLSKISETEDFPKKKNRARPQSAGATRVSRWSEHGKYSCT
jgi:hypothetical protein